MNGFFENLACEVMAEHSKFNATIALRYNHFPEELNFQQTVFAEKTQLIHRISTIGFF